MAYKLNPFTGLLDKVNDGISSTVQTVVLTEDDESNKYITLNRIPFISEHTILIIAGAGGQIYNYDFYVDSDKLKWEGKNIDGILGEGDLVTIIYN